MPTWTLAARAWPAIPADGFLAVNPSKALAYAAALFGAAAVVVGAFGAHLLEGRIAADLMSVYEVGVQYHFYHALAVLALCLGMRGAWNRYFAAAAWCWIGGILLFSGSLYALALTGIRALGAITPLGGTAFIVGWVLLIPGWRRS